MKNLLVVLLLMAFLIPLSLKSQNRHTLRAANRSLSDAESDYRRGNYADAAENYELFLSLVPVSVESARQISRRLDATAALVDIYLNHITDFEKACQNIKLFNSDIEYVMNNEEFRGRQLHNYLQLQNEINQNRWKCDSYDSIDSDKDKFERVFEEEFGRD